MKDGIVESANRGGVFPSDPDVMPIFDQPMPPVAAYAREVAEAKRFCERWRGDEGFREVLAVDADEAMRRWGLEGDPADYRLLYDNAALAAWQADAQRPPAPRAVRRMWGFLKEKLTWREALRRQLRVAHPALDAWRRRQVLRCHAQLPPANAEAIVHAPVAFELSRGCSVGCWFCGVSARKLSEVWPYESNRALWRETLEVFSEVLGPAGGHGFCYWATDPLDNPEYERFCLDYHEIMGAFPQTTTALAHKDVARTRALMALSQSKGCPLNRFSVLTLGFLDRLHAAFSPEELLFTELVQQNPQASGDKSLAGKAREKALARAAREGTEVPPSHASTIACVSGFLVNMVERRVRLVSPCAASSRWPDGFRVHAEATFRDAGHLRAGLDEMLDARALRWRLEMDEVVRLRPDITVEGGEQGIRLAAPFRTLTLRPQTCPGALEVAHRLTAPVPVAHLVSMRETTPEAAISLLYELNSRGLLDDEPGEVEKEKA